MIRLILYLGEVKRSFCRDGHYFRFGCEPSLVDQTGPGQVGLYTKEI